MDFRVVVCERAVNADLLPDLHRLRYRVFKDRLDWTVTCAGGMELDQFDIHGPVYLAAISPDRDVVGCARLMPTTGPTMIRDVFPQLLGGQPAPATPEIWESSRFAVDTRSTLTASLTGLRLATSVLLAGMLEWALDQGLRRITTVTDIRMERILSRAGWPLHRYAEPQMVGCTQAVAGEVAVDPACLDAVRRHGGFDIPVLARSMPLPTARAA